MLLNNFKSAYKTLNKEQKEAVETIDGPVMVIAGPGTGKTQILALRIANILQKTDTKADSVLCLTFTNSAVKAMRERLERYIGLGASRVVVSTFHKFSASIIEEFYPILDFDICPKILEDAESVSICDQILRENEWQYLKPKDDIGRYFKELKSLISLLKRENLSPQEFLAEIEKEIIFIKEDSNSIASRGENKGKLKKEIENKIESLQRTKEIVLFYELYENKKRIGNFMDHDDTIKYALEIVQKSEEVKAELREKFLYILVDEHQDSSGAQNSLLKAIWQEVEKPNIFAVGDDRQLIYAFGGAKLSYFEEFKTTFGKAKIIFLTHNYRSTQNILDTADTLLSSSFSAEKLLTNSKENFELKLIEADYPRDEIIACGLEIKEKLAKGEIDINDCALLVPKNRQAVSAARILKDLNLPVSSGQISFLFQTLEFKTLFRVLKICSNSHDDISLTESLFDPLISLPILKVHEYLYKERGKKINLENALNLKEDLFDENKEIKEYFLLLKNLVLETNRTDIYGLIQIIGDFILLKKAKDHEDLVKRVEVIRSMLHLALSFMEKNNKDSLLDFISFIERLMLYGEDIPLAVFERGEGIKILTLHGSKGLEFDFVWIAHMDEASLMKGKRNNFKLPEKISEKIRTKDELHAKKELYVALTRAKRFCFISYPRFSYSGQNQELANIINILVSKDLLKKISFNETENKILTYNPKAYVISEKATEDFNILEKLKEKVAQEYIKVNVSVSMLNNFFTCPWKWYFRNLLKLPEVKSESLEFGNLIHKAIDAILKSKKTPSLKEIEVLVQKNKKASLIIERWVKNRLKEISENRENEKSTSVHLKEIPYLNIYGKLDLIEDRGASLLVTDFKTGKIRKKTDIEKTDEENRMSDYMRQLAMYSFLIKESRKKEVAESRLEFLEAENQKENFYRTFIDQEKIDLLIKDIKDYDTYIKNGEWIDRKCNFKSYGKVDAECEYCKMAQIYK